MTISLNAEAKAIIRESFSSKNKPTTQTEAAAAAGNGGYRSRGWSPLKYPKSALLQDEECLVYFPLHRDVLLVVVRELLILDGTLDFKTMKINADKTVIYRDAKQDDDHEEEVTLIPSYKMHLDGHSWLHISEFIDETDDEILVGGGSSNGTKRKRKRKKKLLLQRCDNKKAKTDGVNGIGMPVTVSLSKNGTVVVEEDNAQVPSAEDLASVIVKRIRFEATDEQNTIRPRKVSEADQLWQLESVGSGESENGQQQLANSQEISEALDLGKRNRQRAYIWRESPTNTSSTTNETLHVSISNESILRDAAMMMAARLIGTFSDTALRTFFGYKSPSVTREQLSQLLAGLLFDVSHAMFAWEQTEQELLVEATAAPDTVNNDELVRDSLFDQRALKKIGGFDSWSMLPQSISIARLRRRKSSWESFVTTAQGPKMLAHHGHYKTALAVGKLRRGSRLRTRYWLTSAYISNDNDGDHHSHGTATRSRSCSIASSEDGGDEENTLPPSETVDRRTRLLEDIPCSKAIDLHKLPGASWGVCLVKEGEDCVVGRASDVVDGRDNGHRLRCGDMILYAQNASGDEASSRMSAWLTPELVGQDYYRSIVDLFKKSERLELVVQRV